MCRVSAVLRGGRQVHWLPVYRRRSQHVPCWPLPIGQQLPAHLPVGSGRGHRSQPVHHSQGRQVWFGHAETKLAVHRLDPCLMLKMNRHAILSRWYKTMQSRGLEQDGMTNEHVYEVTLKSIASTTAVYCAPRYLLWKNDGNAIGIPTHIYIQRLSTDGLSLAGDAVSLIRNTEVGDLFVSSAKVHKLGHA